MKKQIIFVLVCVLGGSVQATPILDQEQSSYDLDGYRPSSGYKVGQSFTAGLTGTLKQIDMGFLKTIDGDGTVDVFAGYGNAGPLLQTVAVQIYSEDNGQINYNPFTVDVPVESGQQYSFYFEPNPLTMPDPYYLALGYPDPYAGGVLLAVGNGDPWQISECDMVFRTWVEPIPEPATLFLLGLGAVILKRRKRFSSAQE
jgi:hypothetical protein